MVFVHQKIPRYNDHHISPKGTIMQIAIIVGIAVIVTILIMKNK